MISSVREDEDKKTIETTPKLDQLMEEDGALTFIIQACLEQHQAREWLTPLELDDDCKFMEKTSDNNILKSKWGYMPFLSKPSLKRYFVIEESKDTIKLDSLI